MSVLVDKIKAELVLSSYATKADLKYVTGIDTSIMASKADLASLKIKVGNLEKLYTNWRQTLNCFYWFKWAN